MNFYIVKNQIFLISKQCVEQRTKKKKAHADLSETASCRAVKLLSWRILFTSQESAFSLNGASWQRHSLPAHGQLVLPPICPQLVKLPKHPPSPSLSTHRATAPLSFFVIWSFPSLEFGVFHNPLLLYSPHRGSFSSFSPLSYRRHFRNYRHKRGIFWGGRKKKEKKYVVLAPLLA